MQSTPQPTPPSANGKSLPAANGAVSQPQPLEPFRKRLLGTLVGVVAIGLPLLIVYLLVRGHSLVEVRVLDGPGRPLAALAFSPDGQHLAAAGDDKIIRLWDWRTGKFIGDLQGHTQVITSLAYSPDGKFLLAGDRFTARLWDIAKREQLTAFDTPTNFLQSLAIHPNGRTAATTSEADAFVRLWDMHYRDVPGYAAALFASAISSSTAPVACLLRSRIGPIRSPRPIRVLAGHRSKGVKQVRFIDDGKTLISVGAHKVRLWETASGKLLHAWDVGTEIAAAAISGDGATLAAATLDGSIRLWDVEAKRELAVLDGHPTRITAIDFSPDGKYLATAALLPEQRPGEDVAQGRTLRIWYLPHRRECYIVDALRFNLADLRFSPDGRYLLGAGSDGKVHVWQMP